MFLLISSFQKAIFRQCVSPNLFSHCRGLCCVITWWADREGISSVGRLSSSGQLCIDHRSFGRHCTVYKCVQVWWVYSAECKPSKSEPIMSKGNVISIPQGVDPEIRMNFTSTAYVASTKKDSLGFHGPTHQFSEYPCFMLKSWDCIDFGARLLWCVFHFFTCKDG